MLPEKKRLIPSEQGRVEMDCLSLLPVETWRQIFCSAVEPIPQFGRVLEIDPSVSFRARRPWPRKLLKQSLETRLALCLVCKAIRPIAEGLLYELLVVRRYGSLEGLIHTLTLKRPNHGFSLGSLVRTIFLVDFGYATPTNPATESLVTQLFRICPNLSICTFSGINSSIPGPWTNILWALPSTTYSLCWTNAEWFVVSALQYMPCLAQLQHLSFELVLADDIHVAPLQLPRLKSLMFSTPLEVAMECWDMPSLVWVEVVVNSVDGLEMLSPFFQRYGRALEFLQLTTKHFTPTIPPSIFDNCTNLTTFSFDPLSFLMFDSIPKMRQDKLHTLVLSMGGGYIYGEIISSSDQLAEVEVTMQYLGRGLKGLEVVHLTLMEEWPPTFASEVLKIVSVAFPTCRLVVLENPMLIG